MVAHYVDEHKRLGRSKPTDRQIGIVAQTIGEKLDGGARPEHVREAIEKLVEKGNAPSHLASFVSEVEAQRVESARPCVPFVPPGGQTKATPKQQAEAAAGFKKLAEGIGKPMP